MKIMNTDARKIFKYELYTKQTRLVNDLLKNGLITWDRAYNSGSSIEKDTEISEWWLVSDDMARMLIDEDETVIKAYSCNWWGRTSTGQLVSEDRVIEEIAASYFPEPEFDTTRTGARW